jgi:hypothetical protein
MGTSEDGLNARQYAFSQRGDAHPVEET